MTAGKQDPPAGGADGGAGLAAAAIASLEAVIRAECD